MAIQICLYGMNIHGNGAVEFDVEVKRGETTDAAKDLVAIGSAHWSVILDAALLNGIAAKKISDEAKKAEVEALLRAEVEPWRVDEAEDAENFLAALAPETSREKPLVFPLRAVAVVAPK